METNDFTLEDLHEDDDNLDGAQPASPALGDDPPAQDDPPATDPPVSEDPPAQEDPPQEDPPAADDPVASGLELFLSQYDIEGGMITYDDGTTQHISELSAEEQAKILSSVASDARPTVEDQYDLDPTEISLLNELRTSNKSVEDYISDLAQERFNAYKTEIESRQVDYENMSDDAVYVKFLKDKDPEIQDSAVEEGLAIAKDNPTFKTLVKGLRDGFINDQNASNTKADEAAMEQERIELEGDRQVIVDAASKINEVGGFEIPREVKNDVLHDLLEVNEHGDSLFLAETFSNPETMFKTAWFSKYGEDYLRDVESYYKQEITKAFKRGQAAVADGLPGTPRSLNSGTTATPGNEDNSIYDPDAAATMDLEDLHTKD